MPRRQLYLSRRRIFLSTTAMFCSIFANRKSVFREKLQTPNCLKSRRVMLQIKYHREKSLYLFEDTYIYIKYERFRKFLIVEKVFAELKKRSVSWWNWKAYSPYSKCKIRRITRSFKVRITRSCWTEQNILRILKPWTKKNKNHPLNILVV